MKKNIWKKLLSVALCGAMVFSLSACGSSSEKSSSSTKTGSGKTTTVGFIFVGAKDDYGYNIKIRSFK